MMGKSHFWVVSDAVAYIKRYGDESQKRALQTLEMAYGDNKPIEEIPTQETVVERLVGFESLHTDKFGDLALTLRSFPGGGKSNVTGLGFHMFTAFNHFINPYPDTDGSWPNAGGYSYLDSSMKGFDSLVVKGISEHLRGLVDVENSLVLERIRSFWRGGPGEWAANFETDLSGTSFAPWNVLARVYQTHLVLHHYEPLEVRGPNSHLVGVQLLGPLVHAAADACSVQHVRSTLGFGHSVWENYLKSKVYNRQINVNAMMVRGFLSEEPFTPYPTISEGPLRGCFDVSAFICKLAARTADRLQASTSQTWEQLWKAGDQFWRSYLLGASVRDDSHYLYNMAVAGTVQVIVKCYEDLVSGGILSSDKGLLNPQKMPEVKTIQHEMLHLPVKKTSAAPPSEDVMPVPFSQARDLLGFEPFGKNNVQNLLKKATGLMSGVLYQKLDRNLIRGIFRELDEETVRQYAAEGARRGDGFCPLRAMEKLSLDSDLSAHFGTGTFRMPSSDECEDPRLFEQYMNLSDVHAYTANKFQLTQLLAGLKYYRQKFETQEELRGRIDRLTQSLERLREFGENDLAAEAFDLVSPRVERKEKTKTSRELASEKKSLFSMFREWLAPLFHVPVTAWATVAATVLLVVVMLPRGGPESVVGLSSESWDRPGLTLMAPKALGPSVPESLPERAKLAIIINFKDFKEPVSQDVIDASYRAIRPTTAMEKKYDCIQPKRIKEVLEKDHTPVTNLKDALNVVHSTLGASKALVITVVSKGDKFELESVLKNLESGEKLSSKTATGVTRDGVAPGIRKLVNEHFEAERLSASQP